MLLVFELNYVRWIVMPEAPMRPRGAYRRQRRGGPDR